LSLSSSGSLRSSQRFDSNTDRLVTGSSDSYSAGLSASYTVFAGGRRFAELDAARADVRAAEANREDQRFQVTLQTTNTFFEALRQEDLLARIEEGDSAAPPARDDLSEEDLAERTDPRAAPPVPEERDLPDYVFDEETVKVPRGRWGNDASLTALRRSLDADRDGNPEQVRWFDAQSGAYLRKEEDQDYDGQMDAWSAYRGGELVSRELDTNGDGRPDVWERYGGGRMTSRETDRNHDGERDAFYVYQGDSLLQERHDTDYDGRVDFQVEYRDRRRVASEEDSDKDGRMDTWTTYAPAGDEDVVTRVERDASGDGEPDTFETYEQEDGDTVLVRREEDKNGDGVADITSIYEDGKLVRREISDPALMPL